MRNPRTLAIALLTSLLASGARSVETPEADPAAEQPNILIIWGDDIGYWNISAYNRGMMGYRTPNIDRIAQRRRALHRLLRAAKLHGWARGLHHRADPLPHGPDQGRAARFAESGPQSGRGPDARRGT